MSKTITREEASDWLKRNASHIELVEWKCNKDKSRFVDTNRDVEFEYRFSHLRSRIKQYPKRLFGASKEEIQEKTKQTNLERYGTEHPLQNDAVLAKRKETWVEKYGTENPFQNKCIKEKMKQTSLKKYGTSYPQQNHEVQNRIRKTRIKRGLTIMIDGRTLKEVAAEKECGYTTIQQYHKKFGENTAANYEKKLHQNQEYVAKIVQELLPNKEVLIESLTSWNTDKNCPQRFDIFIPELNLAIEYHGRQHYEPIDYFGGEKRFRIQQKLDSYKRKMCHKNGIKLVEIKYDELKYDESDIETIKNKIKEMNKD